MPGVAVGRVADTVRACKFQMRWKGQRAHRTWDPDREQEFRTREIRNRMKEEKLKRGCTAAYRSSGRSLEPTIKSNELCLFAPARAGFVEKGDIVFCKVQPSNQYFAHKVLAKW